MLIVGSFDIRGQSIEMYKDNTGLTECSKYRKYGINVCDDVILVSVISEEHVQIVTISTETFVPLCEVQIFAGKTS